MCADDMYVVKPNNVLLDVVIWAFKSRPRNGLANAKEVQMRYFVFAGILVMASLMVNHYYMSIPQESLVLSGASTVLAVLGVASGTIGTWKVLRGFSKRRSEKAAASNPQPEGDEGTENAKLVQLNHKVERARKELELLEIEKKILELKGSESFE